MVRVFAVINKKIVYSKILDYIDYFKNKDSTNPYFQFDENMEPIIYKSYDGRRTPYEIYYRDESLPLLENFKYNLVFSIGNFSLFKKPLEEYYRFYNFNNIIVNKNKYLNDLLDKHYKNNIYDSVILFNNHIYIHINFNK